MCTVVWLRRAGRIVELDNVRDFARAIGSIVDMHRKGDPRSGRPIRRFATHCLCAVDVEASAKAHGYDMMPTDGWPDYMIKSRRT